MSLGGLRFVVEFYVQSVFARARDFAVDAVHAHALAFAVKRVVFQI